MLLLRGGIVKGLVHIINTELWNILDRVKVIVLDMDGNLTNLYIPPISDLIYQNVLSLVGDKTLVDRIRRDFPKVPDDIHVPVGWFQDIHNGYLILPNIQGRLLAIKDYGATYLGQDAVQKYGRATIDPEQGLDPDKSRPNQLLIADGFDNMDARMRLAVMQMKGYPIRKKLRMLHMAWRKSHDNLDIGFKAAIMAHPANYGIIMESDMIRFFEDASKNYTLVLLTGAQQEYAKKILDQLGISGYFSDKIFGVTKPKCFRDPNSEFWEALARHGIKYGSPKEKKKSVLYMGDHFVKDTLYAHEAGFITVLRMPRSLIEIVVGKLEKYGGVTFRNTGKTSLRNSGLNNTAVQDMNYFLMKLYSSVDAMTSDVHHLGRIL